MGIFDEPNQPPKRKPFTDFQPLAPEVQRRMSGGGGGGGGSKKGGACALVALSALGATVASVLRGKGYTA